MKIAVVLIIVGFSMLPLQVVEANNGSNRSLAPFNASTLMAQSKHTKKDLKVKNRQQAAQMVKNKYRAKVLSVQFIKNEGNPAYKAKLLGNDGIVFYVFVDASSGQMRRL